jgi:hypothetical protein
MNDPGHPPNGQIYQVTRIINGITLLSEFDDIMDAISYFNKQAKFIIDFCNGANTTGSLQAAIVIREFKYDPKNPKSEVIT